MKATRKLSLNTEHLTQLTPDALTGVVAGAGVTEPLDPCVSIRHCYYTENVLRCVTYKCLD